MLQEHKRGAAQPIGPGQPVRRSPRKNKGVKNRNPNEELLIMGKRETDKAKVMCPPYITEFGSADPEEEKRRKQKKPVEKPMEKPV